jgi:hypothetical protein
MKLPFSDRKEKNQTGLLALTSILPGSFRPMLVMATPRFLLMGGR